MGRLIALALFLVIAGSIALHIEADLPPYAQWIGGLPGDTIITKGKITIYLPFTSSLLISAAISLFLSLFRRRA